MEEQNTLGYQIVPYPLAFGGGWKLTLFRNNQEISSKVFPLAQDRRQAGIDWKGKTNRRAQLSWMTAVGASGANDAERAYLRCMAHAEALHEANSWMNANRK